MDDVYGGRAAWAPPTVLINGDHWLFGCILVGSIVALVCMATSGGPKVVAMQRLLGQLMVLATGYHSIVLLRLVGHSNASK